jgi:hypothetical protein
MANISLMILKIVLIFISVFTVNTHAVFAGNAVNAGNAGNAGKSDMPDLYFAPVDTSFHADAYPILTPLESGSLKVLFVGTYDRVASISLEVAARLDCRVETVLTPSRSDFSQVEDSHSERLKTLLGYNWDVIWLDFDIQSLPEDVTSLVFGHVSSGTGLVYAGEMDDVDPFKTRGKIDEEALELVSYETIGSIEAVRRDKGIIAVIPQISSEYGSRGLGDYYNLAAYSVYYTADIPTGTRIANVQMPRKQIEQEVMGIMKYRIHLERGDTPDTLTVTSRFRNDNGEVVHKSPEKFVIQSGRSFVILDFVQLPVGVYSVDISVSGSDGIHAFTGTELDVGVIDKIKDANLWSLSAKTGDFIIGSVNTTTVIKEGIAISAELVDSRGDRIEKFNIELVPGRMTADFSFKIKHSLSRLIFVKLRYYKNNELVQTVEKPLFVDRTYNPFAFSFIVNNSNSSGSGFLLDDKYAALARAGVNVFALDMSGMETAGEMYDAAFLASRTGAGIIPVLSGDGASEGGDVLENRLISAVDTLRHTLPLVYSIGPDKDSDQSGHSAWEGFEKKYLRAADIISKRDSSAVAGIAGVDPALLFAADGGTALAGSFNMIMPRFTVRSPGGGGSENMLPNSVYGNDRAMKGFHLSGSALRGNDDYFRYIPWYSLFNGMNSIWWDSMYGADDAALTPQIGLDPSFSTVAAETREIMNGIDTLILKSKRIYDGIAVYYSPSSLLLEDGTGSGSGSHRRSKASVSMDSFYRACRDLGFSPIVLSDSLLEDMLIESEECSVLILPYSQVIPDASIEIIKEFARAGGTVISDMRPAVLGEDLSMRGSGGLDELFGISQSMEREPSTVTGVFGMSDPAAGVIPLSGAHINLSADPGVSVRDGAEVLAHIGGQPAVIKNAYGEGMGIFLNMEMDIFDDIRFSGDENVYSHILALCLDMGGVRRSFVNLTDDDNDSVPGVGMSIFRDGAADYVGLLAEPSGSTVPVTGLESLKMTFNFTGMSKYIYRLRDNRFLGAKNTVSVEMTPGRAELFALLPYRVQRLDLDIKNSVVRSGGFLEFEVSVISHDSAVKTGHHVLQIRLSGEDNKINPYYTHSVETVNGTYTGSVPLLSDGNSGRLFLEVIDIISGKKSRKGFIISNL